MKLESKRFGKLQLLFNHHSSMCGRVMTVFLFFSLAR